jgi:predicted dehydrogenase
MLGKGKAENTGADNLETVRLIWACYKSADTGKTIKIEEFI